MASLGLVLAIERFDAERGVEFSSFAVPTILGELRRHFRDFGWAIHVTRSDQELVLKVNRETEQLSQRLGRSPTSQELADATRLSVEQVVRALEVAAGARPRSIDEPTDSDDDESTTRIERLGYDEAGFELVESRAAACKGLGALTPREREVLYMRFFQDMTQSEIGERIGVSQMHVCRILRRALERAQSVAEPSQQP